MEEEILQYLLQGSYTKTIKKCARLLSMTVLVYDIIVFIRVRSQQLKEYRSTKKPW